MLATEQDQLTRWLDAIPNEEDLRALLEIQTGELKHYQKRLLIQFLSESLNSLVCIQGVVAGRLAIKLEGREPIFSFTDLGKAYVESIGSDYTLTKATATFEDWCKSLNAWFMREAGYPGADYVGETHSESWRELFNEGCSVAEAGREETSNWSP